MLIRSDFFRTAFWSKIVWYFFTVIFIFSLSDWRLLLCMLSVCFMLEKTHAKPFVAHSFWGVTKWIFLFIVLRTLMVHQGQTVWLRLPDSWPLIGGDITLEGFTGSLVIGLQLILVILWSLMAQRMISAFEWMRCFPGRLRDISTVLLIAIKTIPTLKKNFEETKKIHESRGQTFERLSDYIPLMTTWMFRALEKAMMLSETLEVRGYGKNVPAVVGLVRGAFKFKHMMTFMLVGLFLCVTVFWFKLSHSISMLSGVLLIVGWGLMSGFLWRQHAETF